MNILESKLCDVQGRLFELSMDNGFDSEDFIKKYMNSKVANCYESKYNPMQWMGEHYMLESLMDECNIKKSDDIYGKEIMYWTGYIYSRWHFYTNESSKEIYRQARGKTMKNNYLIFHTLDPLLAIDNLKEIYRQKHLKSQD